MLWFPRFYISLLESDKLAVFLARRKLSWEKATPESAARWNENSTVGGNERVESMELDGGAGVSSLRGGDEAKLLRLSH